LPAAVRNNWNEKKPQRLPDRIIEENNMKKLRAHSFIISLGLAFSIFLLPASEGMEHNKLTIVNLSDQADIIDGDAFKEWMEMKGWSNPLGGPEYFYIRNGRLHLISKPGPVYDDRYLLAIFNRDKLINQIENKVILRVTSESFRIDPENWPLLNFTMTPIELPSEEADLRASGKNDSAFYLIVSFNTQRHDFRGYKMPQSIAYVWANRQWSEPVAADPDYDEFFRYIPIGYGDAELGKQQTISRNIMEDYLTAYPEAKTVPDIIEVGLMIDSNTLGGKAESSLSRIWFEKQ
jgi:hypothetical protein